MTITWWNTSYSIRKKIAIDLSDTVGVSSGDPLYVTIDRPNLLLLNKIRSDFEDIEIVYWNEDTLTWSVLGRDIEYNSQRGYFTVVFNTIIDIQTINNDYYIYYCNPSLKDQAVRPTYIPSTFSTIATPTNGGIMFTKPTEDWDGGVSKYPNSRAAFSFYGKNVKFIFQGRSDGGIVDIKTPTLASQFYDTYSNSEEDIEIIYQFNDVEKNTIRLRATGDKNPTSNGFVIELKRIEYSRYTEINVSSEEIYSISDSIKTMIGS